MAWKFQRFTHDFGASEDSEAVNFVSTYSKDAVGSTGLALARITNTRWHSGGTAAGTTADRNVDDLGVTALLTATNTVTLYRESTGVNEDVKVEVELMEWTGTSGDANGFVVHTQEEVSFTSSGSITGVTWTDQSQGVPILCGIRSTATNQANDRGSCTTEITSSGCTAVKNDTGGTLTASIALVEFGSNWNIQNNIKHEGYSSGGSVETETISAVTWANTLIFPSHAHQRTPCDEVGFVVFPGSTTTTVSFWLTSATSDEADIDTFVHLAEHSDLSVDHDDSVNGGEGVIASGSGQPVTENHTIATQDSLSTSMAIVTCTDSDTGSNYPRGWINYLLTSTTNLRTWKARSGSTQEWAYQIGDFSSVGGGGGTTTSIDVPLATATATGLAPTVDASTNVWIDVPLATATATGLAPTVDASANIWIDIPLATATATGYAPTVTISADTAIAIPLATATATGLAPTVDISENVWIDVPLATATATAYAPTVTTGTEPSYSRGASVTVQVSGLTVEVAPRAVSQWNTAGRPANPVLWEVGYNSTIGDLEVWNGSAWVTSL